MPINEIDIESLPSGQVVAEVQIDQGLPGPPNTLAIGTVTSGPAPSATITGPAPQQTLNLVLPKGDTGSQGLKGDKGDQGEIGLTGPANSLSIGTVTSGETAAATITGTAPAQVLNLVLEKGDKGDQGDAATLTLGTVSTGAAGSNVSITNSGTSSDAVFNFSIPRGDKGETGDVGPTGPVGPEPSLNVTDNAGTSITLEDTDNNKVVRCTSATAVTITVPSTLAAGFSCMVIQAGAGQITFVQGSGATLNSFGNLFKTAGQHAPASLIRVGAGIYNLSGNLV